MRTTTTLCLLLSAALAGCPVPPQDNTEGQGSTPAAPSGVRDAGKTGKAGGPPGPTTGSPGTGGPGAGGPGGPGGGAGGVLMILDQMTPQQTQEQVQAAGNYATITGEVTGECAGTVRIDVIDEALAGAPPSAASGIPGPLTLFTMTGSGPFSLVAPKDKSVNLTALCDNDNDGKISNTIDAISLGAKLGNLTEDQSGVSLELSLLSAAGIPGSGPGGGPGGPGAGGPADAGGPGAGGPADAGGPGAGGPAGAGEPTGAAVPMNEAPSGEAP